MKRLDVLSAAAALLFVATAAQAQRGQDNRHGRQDQHQDQHPQPAPQAQPRQGGGGRGGEAQPGGNTRARDDQTRADQARADQARAEQARTDQARTSAEQSQRRVAEQNYQWRDQQNRQAQQQQQSERARQAQQQAEQLERERQAQANRAFDRDRDFRNYDRDRDVGVIHDYRYNIRGVYRETNQFGADVLRQALDRGYDEGYRSGLNDRRDGVRSDFQRALDFESGGFGYAGGYVPADDYSYYFREGFQRGYDDGYWNRSNYGTFSNGKTAIVGAIALGILGLTMIR